MAGISISKNDEVLFSYMFDPGIFLYKQNRIPRLSHIHNGMTPSWSPNGSKIAFQLLPALVFGNSDVDNLKIIDENGRDPSWSSDGSQIAYTHQAGFDEEAVVKVVDMSNNKKNIIGNGESPTWSPDGKRLAFWNRGIQFFNSENRSISSIDDQIVFDKDSGGSHDFMRDLVWSPNGDQLMYVSYGSRLTMVNLESMTARNIQGIRPWAIGWYPDGEKIAFVGHLEGENTLKIQAALYSFDLITNKEYRIMYVMS